MPFKNEDGYNLKPWYKRFWNANRARINGLITILTFLASLVLVGFGLSEWGLALGVCAFLYGYATLVLDWHV